MGDGIFRFSPHGDGFEVSPTHIPKGPIVKQSLIGAELYGGYLLGIEDSRDVPWSVDLGAAAERMAKCEQGWVLLWDGAEFKAAPMLCGGRWCPRCVRARVGRVAHRWVPVLLAAAQGGAHIYHLTLTQPVGYDPPPGFEKMPALVLPEERKSFIGKAIRGKEQRAVPGESIAGSYKRFRDHWRSVRQDRSTRDLWRYALGGYLYGIEWTQRPKNADGPCVPRWHCHAHVLVVHPTGWRRGTWGKLRDSWCEQAGAHPDAQWCDRVEGSAEQDLASALLEVCKYPIKLLEVSLAGQIEAFASLRGTRPHHVGGALHATSSLAGAEPWRSWLAAAQPAPSWPRLQVFDPYTASWSPYTGQHHAGRRVWRLGDEGEHGEPWEAEAGPYWEVMKTGLLDSGYAERDGVVLDDSAALEHDSDEGAA
jgi:hypothetical protein